jgi:hypothetical protein
MPNQCVWVKVLVILLAVVSATWGQYRVGVGRADCTGPAAEIAFVSISYFLSEFEKFSKKIW